MALVLPHPAIDLMGEMLRYYDYVLLGEDNGFTDDRPVRIFVMGENVWRYEDEWPLARAEETKYYLHSRGQANSLNGDGALSTEEPGDEAPDVYVYNPLTPVPTVGGGLCCDPAFQANGAFDQRWVEDRQDVLVYSTPPLADDVEVTGPITVTLYASTNASDTDFTAKLVDVEPSGYARNLTDGIIRARYRNVREPASSIRPGDRLRVHDRPVGYREPIQEGPPDQGGGFELKLPEVRSQHQYWRRDRGRDGVCSGVTDRVSHV